MASPTTPAAAARLRASWRRRWRKGGACSTEISGAHFHHAYRRAGESRTGCHLSSYDARAAMAGGLAALLDLPTAQGGISAEPTPGLAGGASRERSASHFPECPKLT